ncbi:MAG: NAD(+)/NADH kinase [Spirochaetia bacterium]
MLQRKPLSHSHMPKCLLIVHDLKPGLQDLALGAGVLLRNKGFVVEEILHGALLNLPPQSSLEFDFALIFGGDGLSLSVGCALAPMGIPVMAVNMGRVGFMTGFTQQNWEQAIQELLLGGLLIRQRDTLVCQRKSHADVFNLALNEFYFVGQSRHHLCELEVTLDSQGALLDLRGDGLILATPTGSTAYASSCGGPMISTDLHAILLLCVNPYSMAVRPMVLSGKSEILVRLSRKNRYPAVLVRDGQDMGVFSKDDEAVISISQFPAQFLYPQNHSPYARICDKITGERNLCENKSRVKD